MFSSWLECSATFLKVALLLSFCGAVQSASAQVYIDELSLAPNGDFETPNSPWGFSGGGPAGSVQDVTYPATDGNPGGYVRVDTSADTWWTVLISNNDQPSDISEFGLTAGQTYTFQYDMRTSTSGENIGGMKIESWADGSSLGLDSGDVRATVETADTWATYTFEYTIPANANQIKFVPLWSSGVVVDFDNIGVMSPVRYDLVTATNGDFENGGSNWGHSGGGEGGSTQLYDYPTTGGNPDGFARLDSSVGTWWSVLYSDPADTIADLGLTAGETYTFQWDMRSSATGTGVGALKVENGDDAAVNMEVAPDVAVADQWATYRMEWTIPEGMTTIKFVPVWATGVVVDFDNMGVLVEYVESRTVTASASTGGSIDPAGEVAVNNGDSQTFTITPDAGYTIGDILVNGASVGNVSPYDLTNVRSDTTVEVLFAYQGFADPDFNNGGSEWRDNSPSEGTWVFSAPSAGGPDDSAHVVIDNTEDDGGEGYLTANNDQVIALSDLSGIAAGSVYTVDVDMKVVSGIDYGSIQFVYYETDSEGDWVQDGATTQLNVDPFYDAEFDGEFWDTYSFQFYVPHGTEGLKVRLYGAEGSVVAFDNVTLNDTALATYAASEIPDPGFEYGQAAYEENGASEAIHTMYDANGNPDGYAEIDNSAGGWGILVANCGAVQSLDDLGLNADETYLFNMDMRIADGDNIGGLKIDFFNGLSYAGSTGDIRVTAKEGAVTAGDTWENYEFAVQLPSGIDGIKIVPLFGQDSTVEFDNLAFSTTPYVAPPVTHTWTGGAGDNNWSDASNWDTGEVPNLSNSAANATAVIGAGATVEYDPGVGGGDFQLRNGNILQIDAGGTFKQINSGSWFQTGGGVLKLNGGTFDYGTCPTIAGREEDSTVLEVTANGGTIVNRSHTTELNWGTLTLNGPLDIDATGREIGNRGKELTLAAGSDWVANAFSFAGDPAFLNISGGSLTVSGGAGISVGQGTDRGLNFLSGSTGEVVWSDPGVSVATAEALVNDTTLTIDGAAAALAAFSITERSGAVVASLANVDKSVTTSVTGSGSISGPSTVAYNGSATYTITPDAGNVIADVLVDGSSIGIVSSYTLSGVVQNRSISAAFIEEGAEYTISASAGTGGSISPSGDTAVTYGSDQSYTITPDSGYYILDVQVNGSSVGNSSTYDFTNVTAGATISVSFTDRELLKLDFQGALGAGDNVYNTDAGWITLLHDPSGQGRPWEMGDEVHPNVGGSGYDFTTVGVGAWSSGWMWKPEFGAGGAVFTLGGLTPGQEVILYAAAGWAPAVEGVGAHIVFGDSGAAGVKAIGGGQSEGNSPLPADLTEIGTAIADSNGQVSGAIGNRDNFTDGNEGQTNGFIFSIGAAPQSTNNFSDWIGGYSVGSDTGIDGDYDNDGLANGVENILGTDPSAANASGITSGTVSAGGDTFTFTHSANASPSDDLTASYQWSTDLTNFYTDGQSDGSTTVSFSAVTDSGVTTVTATITGTTPEKLFVQLSVSQ